jgi:hypothetical protein
MIMNIKQRRQTVLKAVQSLISGAIDGDRYLTDQEVTQVKAFHDEIAGYDATIARVGGQKSLTQAIADQTGPG